MIFQFWYRFAEISKIYFNQRMLFIHWWALCLSGKQENYDQSHKENKVIVYKLYISRDESAKQV